MGEGVTDSRVGLDDSRVMGSRMTVLVVVGSRVVGSRVHGEKGHKGDRCEDRMGGFEDDYSRVMDSRGTDSRGTGIRMTVLRATGSRIVGSRVRG